MFSSACGYGLQIRTIGVDPSAIPKMTTSELYSLAEKVFPEMYAESGCQELKIDPNMKDHARTDSADVINKQTGKMISTSTISTTFGPSAFKSFLQLASTMGHEFTHSIHNMSGAYVGWFNSKGGGYAYHKSEILAHEWQINLSAPVNMPVYNSHLNWMSSHGF